jgi:uncharacterized damage-inducible protein DinB
MKKRTVELIGQLQGEVRELILKTNYIKKEDNRVLTIQPAPGEWSVTQVLAHMNSYGSYYLPAIEKSMTESVKPAAEWFRAGWLGDYFTRIMRPGINGKIANKMKAPKEHSPLPLFDVNAVFETFIEQQFTLLNLLEEAKRKNIGSIRTPVSISKFIKLKTGDTFRFIIAHEQRHFVQISNILKQLKETELKLVNDNHFLPKAV